MNGSSSGQTNGTHGTQTSMDQNILAYISAQNEANVESEFDAMESNSTDSFSGFPKNINEEKQGKHIPGQKTYQPGKSILSISAQEAQDLVNEKSGKGEKVSNNKERVDFGRIIGYYIDPSTGERKPTSVGMIHYSKTGTHIVPSRPKDNERKNEDKDNENK